MSETHKNHAEADKQALACVGCGYLLRGLALPGVCPECGVGFDGVVRRRRWRGWKWVRRVFVLLMVIAVVAGSYAGWVWREWKGREKAIGKLEARQVVCGGRRDFTPAWVKWVAGDRLRRYYESPVVFIKVPKRRYYDSGTTELPPPDDDSWLGLLSNFPETIFVQPGNTVLTEFGFRTLVELKAMKMFNFGESKVDDSSLATAVRNWALIENLRIGGLTVGRKSISAISESLKLESLSLTHVRLTLDDWKTLSRSRSIKTIEIERANLNDEGLAAMGNMVCVSEIKLYGTIVTQEGVERMRKMRPGIVVKWQN